jgi:endonuclease YncB( thermonuclease family)
MTMTRPPYGLCLPCRLVRAIDGDTVVVALPGSCREWSIRLLDCWAAEMDTPQGRRAKDFLESRLAGQEGLAVFVPAPKEPIHLLRQLVTLDRVLARLFLADGRDVSELMVAGGLASPEKPKPAKTGKQRGAA